MLIGFTRARSRLRWLKRQRERDVWLFAATFVLILIAGLALLAAVEGASAAPEINYALVLAAIALAVLAPAPLRRFVWHTLANHMGVSAPRSIIGVRVIDGDTLEDASGSRYRLANIDAPETGDNAKCHREAQRGELATNVVKQMVAASTRIQVRQTFRTDRYGRSVAFVVLDGVDLGETLVKRGLARPWRGHRRKWCGPKGGLATMARAGLMPHTCGACSHWKA